MMPKDPMILLSYVNTCLRDHYPTLSEFCHAEMVEESQIIEMLAKIDYQYDPVANRFL